MKNSTTIAHHYYWKLLFVYSMSFQLFKSFEQIKYNKHNIENKLVKH